MLLSAHKVQTLLHDKTSVIPMDTNLILHAIQLMQSTQAQTHP